MGNMTIKDKVLYIESLSVEDKTNLFQDELSERMFGYVATIFKNSNCPTSAELSLFNNKDDAIAKVVQYFNEEFDKDYSKYIDYFKENKW